VKERFETEREGERDTQREGVCVCVSEKERERGEWPTVLSQMVTTTSFSVLWVGLCFQQLNMCFT